MAAGGGLLLGQADRQRRKGTLRLAQGQVRSLVAGPTHNSLQGDAGPRSAKSQTGEGPFPENEETGYC